MKISLTLDKMSVEFDVYYKSDNR